MNKTEKRCIMIELIIGPARSGKTTRCYKEIEKALSEDAYNNLIVLVPEQFNLQVQMDLAKRLYPGLLRVEVMSFNNLSEKVIKEVSGMKVPLIDDLERIMILKKIIEANKRTLTYFKKSHNSEGFIENINRLITLFEQNGMDQGFLKQMLHQQTSDVFRCKIQDLTAIYGWFIEAIEEQFVTAEKTIEHMAKCIAKSDYLKDAYLWIDGFYGFTAPQLSGIFEMMNQAKHCVITLPIDRIYEDGEYILPTNPFYDSIKHYQKIKKYCETQDLPYQITYLNNQKMDTVAEPLHYLGEMYLNPFVKAYNKPQQSVEVYHMGNKEMEIEEIARQIKGLVRDKGYRYRDIAVLVGDLNDYQSSLANTFDAYEIPYFMDKKRSIHTTPLVAVTLAALDVITSNWHYRSMMHYLRLNMLGFLQESIDQVENYILEHGIQGSKKWSVPWERESKGVDLQVINEQREKISKPLQELHAYFNACKDEKGRMCVKDATIAMYKFLESIEAYETIEARRAYYEDQGNTVLMQESAQIWGQVIEVMERLVGILGNEKVSLSVYKNLLKTSFSYMKMGMIPPSKDQLIIGTVERTRLPQLKAVCLLGVNEGKVPKSDDTMMLFSEMDKLTLTQLVEKGDEKKERLVDLLVHEPLFGNQLTLYSVLTRATEKLYISAVQSDEQGKPIRPSQVFYKLKKMFGLKEVSNDALTKVQTPIATLEYIGNHLRSYIQGEEIEEVEWYDVLSWYLEKETWRDKILHMSRDLAFTNQQHYLKKEQAKLLYPNGLETNISQLEAYRQCPCCYFIKYGIKASERKMLQWNAADLGTLFHATLEQYPKELAKKQKTWIDVTEAEMRACVAAAVKHSVDHTHYAGRDEGRIRYTLAKVERMSERAIHALTHQLKQGEFTPYAYEVSFGYEGLPPIEIALDDEHTILLKGQIDRVDVYIKNEQERYIKILDYKSGNKQFSLLEVYHSLQLQLLLYLDAYLRLNPGNKPAGMFYFHIDSKTIKYERGIDQEEAFKRQLKQFKLSGLMIDDVDLIELMEEGVKGEVVPAELKKDGSLSARSSVASEKQFECLRAYMMSCIQNLGKDMLAGKISARPCKLKEKDACVYCKYKTICQFDDTIADNTYQQLEQLKDKEIWEHIITKVKKGDA